MAQARNVFCLSEAGHVLRTGVSSSPMPVAQMFTFLLKKRLAVSALAFRPSSPLAAKWARRRPSSKSAIVASGSMTNEQPHLIRSWHRNTLKRAPLISTIGQLNTESSGGGSLFERSLPTVLSPLIASKSSGDFLLWRLEAKCEPKPALLGAGSQLAFCLCLASALNVLRQ